MSVSRTLRVVGLFPSAGGVASEAGRGGLVEQRLAVYQRRKATTPPFGHPSWGGELRQLRVEIFCDRLNRGVVAMMGGLAKVSANESANGACSRAWMREFSAILPGMMINPANPADLADHALMQRYCDGDLRAFQELYRRHSQGLYQFIAWRSPRREWVDEIVQDSWAALHEARGRYQALAGFRTYLYQIGRNRLIDILRQKQAVLASEMVGSLGDDGDDATQSRFEQLADAAQESNSPEAQLEKKQQVAALHEAIRSLPGEQKEALVLQQFNGLSLEEIAEITAVSVETVKSRLRYAMQKLRSQLQGSQVRGALA